MAHIRGKLPQEIAAQMTPYASGRTLSDALQWIEKEGEWGYLIINIVMIPGLLFIAHRAYQARQVEVAEGASGGVGGFAGSDA